MFKETDNIPSSLIANKLTAILENDPEKLREANQKINTIIGIKNFPHVRPFTQNIQTTIAPLRKK